VAMCPLREEEGLYGRVVLGALCQKRGRSVTLFWLSFGFGLVTTSVLAIAAIGLSLQFGITNYINFAYGDFMALGGFFTYFLNNEAFHINIWISVAIATLAMGVFGVLINRLLLGPFARRFSSTHYVLIVTFGLSLVMLNIIYSIWGANVRFYSLPPGMVHHVGPLLLTTSQLIVMGISLVLLASMHTTLKVTRLGKSMRAM
jgi:branched-subunit amino acid ABC-type transport system permease component